MEPFSHGQVLWTSSGYLHLQCLGLTLTPAVSSGNPNSISRSHSAHLLLIGLSSCGWNVSKVAGSLLTKSLLDCFGDPALFWNLIKTTP